MAKESTFIIRRADMSVVLETYADIPLDKLRAEFVALTAAQWLCGFNAAVKTAGGAQPSPELIRAQFQQA